MNDSFHNDNERYETVNSAGETPAQPVEATPVRDDAWSDAGYVPSADASEVPRCYRYSAPAGKKAKTRRGMPAAAVVALCLVCAILGGLAVGYAPRPWNGAPAEPVESAAAVAMDGAAPVARFDAPSDAEAILGAPNTANPSGAVLSGTDIYYELATKQTVAITTEITYTNYFGYTSTGAVKGSGFIISSDGYILTNHHVIEDAVAGGYDITVLLYDGTEYTAAVVGYESDNDVALLKIDATGLTPVSFGDSDSLRVGESVYVVGNPLGTLEFSMSTGTVSGIDRELTFTDSATRKTTTISLFQLDAAVNSGNSGGPVYNDRGEVIGIVTAKYSSSGVEGLGFAIPINDAIAIAYDLMDDGVVSGKPYLGILEPDTLSATYAQYYGVEPGVYFQALEAGGPAEKAGLQVGDIIVGLGDKEIASKDDLTSAMRDYRAGDTATIRVYRGGQHLDLTVTFGDVNDATGTASGAGGQQRQQQQQPQQRGGGSYYDYFSEFFDELNPFA